jgi:AhpD family alkylhydroperoxidase
MTTRHSHETLEELRRPTQSLRHAIPDVWAGFLSLHRAALADGTLPARLKEGVALAIAAAKQCDGCIAHHAEAAARAGAKPAEIAELLGVVVLMDGGPGTVYAPRAWDAFLEFSDAAIDTALATQAATDIRS